MKIAVVGAHLSGQPLNGQLTERGARLVRTARTRALYRFYAVANTTPAKPGLVRVNEPVPNGIEIEIWELGAAEFGTFVEMIPPPLGVGTLETDDGELVKGFLVEAYAVAPGTGSREITHLGGWRSYLKSLNP